MLKYYANESPRMSMKLHDLSFRGAMTVLFVLGIVFLGVRGRV